MNRRKFFQEQMFVEYGWSSKRVVGGWDHIDKDFSFDANVVVRFSKDYNLAASSGNVTKKAREIVKTHVDGFISTALFREAGMRMDCPYIQALDERPWQWNVTRGGWCLGIASAWLERKVAGTTELFPDELHEPGFEKTLKALMENQKKLMDNKAQFSSDKDPRVINAIQYICRSGKSAKPTQALYNFNQADLGKHRDMVKVLKDYIGVTGKELFLIAQDFTGGGGHAIALDLKKLQLFDPNHGVMGTTTDSLKDLVKFLFEMWLASGGDLRRAAFYPFTAAA